MIKRLASAAVVFVVSVAAASAATYTFDFAGSIHNQSSVDFASIEDPNFKVNVTAKRYNVSGGSFVGGSDIDVETNAWGLISDNPGGDRHYIDSWGSNEAMIFKFADDLKVSITDIVIGYWDRRSDYRGYDLFVGDQLAGNSGFDSGLLATAEANSFAIGARSFATTKSYSCRKYKKVPTRHGYKWVPYRGTCSKTVEHNTGFKLRSITVSYEIPAVPLPATGFLLFGALGGLGAMRRRKKAA